MSAATHRSLPSEKQMDPTLRRENPKTIAAKNTPEEIPRRIQHDF
jgi:hypothetical protein